MRQLALALPRRSRPFGLLAASLLALALALHQSACMSGFAEPSCNGFCTECGCPKGERCEQGLGDPFPICR